MDDPPVIDPEDPELPVRRSRAWRILGRSLLGIALIVLGAIGTIVALRSGVVPRSAFGPATPPGVESGGSGSTPSPSSRSMIPLPDPTPSGATPSSTDDVDVTLSAEALARVGIQTARVEAVEGRTTLQVPGSVMPNSYREVKVSPIAGGIVTRVHGELGAAVRRGASLATLFSTDLADAQTKYLSMATMVDADHKKLERTQKLAEIGAASRQELEEVTAVHTSHATELEAARQRLLLLGLTPEQAAALVSPTQVVSEIAVPAPIDGVITARTANLGQVVGMGQELFVVTDLSEVWVVGDLYEQDFGSVAVGSEAVVTVPAYPGLSLGGRVGYIDPRVDPQTRTTKVRVEVPNPDGRLRLGMYVSLAFTTRGGDRTVVVPQAAVQAIGDRHVVYVPAKDEPGRFRQRTIQLGRPLGDRYAVVGGLQPGETVVTTGSFFLRAEAIRNNPP